MMIAAQLGPRAAAPDTVSNHDEVRSPTHATGLWDLEGYRVDDNDGRIGVVERVVGDPREKSAAIEVTTGLFVIRTVLIPLADVVEVDRVRRRLVIRSRPRPRRPRARPRTLGRGRRSGANRRMR